MRVSILGSCITRDVFRLFPDDAEVVSYHSRSSLVSLMSPPLLVDDAGTEWPSNFARKVVLADFRKTFFDELELAGPDVLILDLMSERFDLLRASGTYVTRSWDLVESGFDERCAHALERVPRENYAVHDAWRRKSREFAASLRTRFPTLPVILHKAYWSLGYRKGASIRPFSPEWRAWISPRNAVLEAYHAYLERHLTGVVAVEPRQMYFADPGHRWGLGSSHYEAAYYADVRQQLHAAFHSARTRAGTA